MGTPRAELKLSRLASVVNNKSFGLIELARGHFRSNAFGLVSVPMKSNVTYMYITMAMATTEKSVRVHTHLWSFWDDVD